MSGAVDPGDPALILLDFGPCGDRPPVLEGNGTVDFAHATMRLMNFGPTS